VLIMLIRASRPDVAFLGRVPGTTLYSDIARHPENETIPGVLVFRPDGSLLYVNADNVLGTVLARLASEPPGSVRLVVCDLSAAPHLDLAAVGMLRKLHATLEGQRIRLAVAGPHGEVRDLLRREGFADLVWQGNYSLPAMVLNVVLRLVPTKVNAAIAATAINAAISAYSIAVTPD
jgi:MFS superfamily sulfate permease-like transporter